MIEPVAESASERALLLRAAAGDPDSARELLDLTTPAVYGFVFARVGGRQDVAEDIVQTTFLEAMRSAGGYRGDSALVTWLCVIARRQVAQYFESERRRLRLQGRLRLVASDEEAQDEAAQDVHADRDAMIAALGRLIPLHRQVLVLKYLDDLSVDEIAREMNRSKVQIQSLLQRARAGLRRELEGAG